MVALVGGSDEITSRMLGGFFGWSDQTWSLVVQVAGLVIAVLIGTMSRTKAGLFGSLAVGFAVNVIGQLYMAGGGPGFFMGIVVLPLSCAGCYLLGRGVRRLALRRSSRT